MLIAIADYLNSQGIAVFNKTNETLNQIYEGQIDLTKDTCIGLYNDLSVIEIKNIGTDEQYEEYGFTILIHWSRNYETAVSKAQEVYDLFKEGRFTSDGYEFWNIRCVNGQPVYTGTRNDVYEFVLIFLVKINL